MQWLIITAVLLIVAGACTLLLRAANGLAKPQGKPRERDAQGRFVKARGK